ncbi:MAG: 50S ribosomal protein L37ae [Thermoplasmatota archaeon]
MVKKKKVGSTGRFGPRYGVKVRRSIKDLEKEQKDWYECPRCHHEKVKRESSGIWNCKKCGLKFAGGAYKPHLGRRIKRLEEEEE